MVQLTAIDYSSEWIGKDDCCFIGENDHLVASPSNEIIYVWSLPEENIRQQMVNSKLIFRIYGLPGQSNTVRYSPHSRTLASFTHLRNIIKLWTPDTNVSGGSEWIVVYVLYICHLFFNILYPINLDKNVILFSSLLMVNF